MNHSEVIEQNNLLNEFITSSQLQHSGKLEIKSSQGNIWSFYYRLGRIVWATGGTHPWRRWRRHMVQHCPEIDCDKMRFRVEDTLVEHWDYNLLVILYQRQQLKREQIKVIVDSTISELLFDVVQQINVFATGNSNTCNSVLRRERNQEVILETPLSFTSADLSLKQVEDSWKMWSDAGLVNIFPDFAPVLRKPDRLQQQVSPSVYKNFVTLLNGKYSLRDLAVKMNHNPLSVARSLLPYIQKEIVELVEVPDLPLMTEIKNNSTSNKFVESTAPLVACVDDSLQVCQMLEKIITSNGLRFLKIQDSVQALPTIIQHKPDLIFLDLVMPVVSGYELCAQLRRISTFADTPVIIITGSDGFIDRVRAKVVNSTHFITKPIAADKVMSVIHKYLKIPRTSSKSQSNLQKLPLTGS
ncbi:two-component system response regulator [Scytonema hofmannii PCC 7110]|uniref:Protein PatA n=1 Tax=Scytonema hofmannii PCC 7110 TaxID=128403 RepID=A0A139XCR6_9CYAN|nr:response regulator [Scytonema hofmannii]KYC42489.1 two-component system response regulator [Scytonema hofmannii PCC 7110]